MNPGGTSSRKVLLFQLEENLKQELEPVLTNAQLALDPEACSNLAECRNRIEEQRPYMVFSHFSPDLVELLHSLKEPVSRTPVIVVSRDPNAHEWIEAMEAGAADYCAAPFELHQIRWIVQANARPSLMTAA
jgi:DNA-binding NtrC family response regulator